METMETNQESEKVSTSNVANSAANNNFLPASILVAAVLIAGSIFYSANRNAPSGGAAQVGGAPQAAAPVVDYTKLLAHADRDVVLGEQSAPVTLVIFSDFQCPFCGKLFTGAEPQIREQYVKTGKVKIVYRHMAFLGPESIEAAKASECAKDQGKFWAFHDELFKAEIADGTEHNGNLNRTLFVKLAAQAGLDAAKLGTCYDANTYADVVAKETSDAQAAGVNATPTSFVNGQIVQGAQPFDQFKTIIDQALAGT